MIPSTLKPGLAYFMATYRDSTLLKPVVITYEYVGQETFEEDGEPAYIFKYLPAFQGEGDPEVEAVALDEKAIAGLVDLDGLIRELQERSAAMIRVRA